MPRTGKRLAFRDQNIFRLRQRRGPGLGEPMCSAPPPLGTSALGRLQSWIAKSARFHPDCIRIESRLHDLRGMDCEALRPITIR